MKINNLTILSWDITNNSLIYKGWRQNFGLYYPEEVHNLSYQQSYNQRIHIFKYINSLRLQNIIRCIKNYKPDILLLHGISNDKVLNLGELTIQDYIAKILNFTVISTSYNNYIEKWDLPPYEQYIDSKNIKSSSGVSTLLSNKINCRIDDKTYKININDAYNLNRLFFLDSEFIILNIDCDISKLKNVIVELNKNHLNTDKMFIVAKKNNNLVVISNKFTFKNLKINLPLLKTNINNDKNPERWKNYWNNQIYDKKDSSIISFNINKNNKIYKSRLSSHNYKILKKCFAFTGIYNPLLITNLKQI